MVDATIPPLVLASPSPKNKLGHLLLPNSSPKKRKQKGVRPRENFDLRSPVSMPTRKRWRRRRQHLPGEKGKQGVLPDLVDVGRGAKKYTLAVKWLDVNP